MGVYISDMELPKSRPVCIVIDAAGQARRYDLNNDRYADDKLFEAVHVPARGRLIDANTLIELIAFEMQHYVVKDEFDKGRVAAWNNVIHAIREYAPTIIPEEGE